MSPTHATALAELAALVARGNALASDLLGVLELERDALTAGRVEDIDACGARKVALLTELETLEADRASLATAAGLDAERLDDAFASAALTAKAAPGWESLLGTLRACHEANAVNGQITLQRRRHVERALHILRGTGEQAAGLYGPDGRDAPLDAAELARA